MDNKPQAWMTRDLRGNGKMVFATHEKAQLFVEQNFFDQGTTITPLYARQPTTEHEIRKSFEDWYICPDGNTRALRRSETNPEGYALMQVQHAWTTWKACCEVMGAAKAATEYRTDAPPMDGTAFYSVGEFQLPYRYALYSPNSEQARRGIKGRWQVMGDHGGWSNTDVQPTRWRPHEGDAG